MADRFGFKGKRRRSRLLGCVMSIGCPLCSALPDSRADTDPESCQGQRPSRPPLDHLMHYVAWRSANYNSVLRKIAQKGLTTQHGGQLEYVPVSVPKPHRE